MAAASEGCGDDGGGEAIAAAVAEDPLDSDAKPAVDVLVPAEEDIANEDDRSEVVAAPVEPEDDEEQDEGIKFPLPLKFLSIAGELLWLGDDEIDDVGTTSPDPTPRPGGCTEGGGKNGVTPLDFRTFALLFWNQTWKISLSKQFTLHVGIQANEIGLLLIIAE